MMKNGMITRLKHNKLFLCILSIVLAYVIWLVVVIGISPNYTRTISGVPVAIDIKSGFLAEAGLGLVDRLSQNVTIEVAGPRTIIGKLDASDFTVTPDVGAVTSSGTYDLQLSAALKTPDSQVRIRSISPAQIPMQFDTVSSKTLSIVVRVQNSKVADGYVMETATAAPKEVVVSGPSAEVEKVAQVQADVSMGNGVSSTYKTKVSLKIMDSSGNALSLSHVKLSASKVTVTVPVFKTGSVPLKVDFTNIPDGFDTKNLQYTVSPDTLHVAGAAGEIGKLTRIDLGHIDFRTLSLTNRIVLPIKLTGTLQNMDNIAGATITVHLLDTVTQDVSTQNIQVVNAPAKYSVKLRTLQINGIHLFGPAAQMGTPPDVSATIDMSSALNGTGQYVVPVTISTPSGFWTTGSYTAVILVSKTR